MIDVSCQENSANKLKDLFDGAAVLATDRIIRPRIFKLTEKKHSTGMDSLFIESMEEEEPYQIYGIDGLGSTDLNGSKMAAN